jgi:hypothetical protein
VRVVALGALRGPGCNRWRDDAVEGARALGWHVTHIDAQRVPVDDVVELCRGADALLWLKTHRDPAGRGDHMLRRVEDMGVTTVGVHMDLHWSLPHRERRIGHHPWWSCQHVFTADGGLRDWAGRGVNHHWLPPAASPHLLGASPPDRDRFPHPVVFVGDHVPRLHSPHRAELLAWARHRFGNNFAQYGRARPVWGEAFSTLCASAAVVLGDSAPADRYWSDRVPLTLSQGGLLAHPHTAGLAECGFTDEALLLYNRYHFDQLEARVDDLTVRERRTLTANAVDLIRDRHLWQHRMADIAQVVSQ